MLRLVKFSASALCGLAMSVAGFAHDLQNKKVQTITLKSDDLKSEIRNLRENGYEILGVDIPGQTVSVILNEQGLAGISLKTAKIVGAQEIDTMIAPDARYTDYSEMEAFVKKMATTYPDISRLSSAGKTVEGREMWLLKITSNPDQVDTSKPNVFFNAMHHAREVMTAEVGMDVAEFLLSNYESNEEVRSWIDRTVIWVLPMVNPDGNNKVWKSDNMWRKNVGAPKGVDINRNYPYRWGGCNGSSGTPSKDDYRGPSAASEPETQAMVNFVKTVRPVMSISFHSFSELVLYPLSCKGERAPNHDIISKIGAELAAKLPSESGNGFYKPGTSWEILYAVDGGDTDFMLNEAQTIPYVIEMNKQNGGLFSPNPFEPDYTKFRQKTVEKMRAAWGHILNRVNGSGLSGVINSSAIVDGATVTVEGLGANGLKPFTKKVVADGVFHFVLDPGMYKMTIHNGTQTETHDVTVGAVRQQLGNF